MPSSSLLAIVTQSALMRAVLAQIETIARSDMPVLLVGETGVGKELFADYLHKVSDRSHRPFIKIALSAMPHELLESELFGHERGAFTSAVGEKQGLFELANGGSLFLDDIDDVPAGVQVRLLRALESHEVIRVGGSMPIPVDVRLITASKIDLKDLVDRHLFRADLFYRINVCSVEIPPLRDRREDVPLLAAHFLRRFGPRKTLSFTPDAERALACYDWPGNVRELRNVVQRLTLFADHDIGVDQLPTEFRNGHPVDVSAKACRRCLVEESLTYTEVVTCLEINLLKQAMEEAGGNRSQAARMLGLSLSTLRDKLTKFRLNAPDPEPARVISAEARRRSHESRRSST